MTVNVAGAFVFIVLHFNVQRSFTPESSSDHSHVAESSQNKVLIFLRLIFIADLYERTTPSGFLIPSSLVSLYHENYAAWFLKHFVSAHVQVHL